MAYSRCKTLQVGYISGHVIDDGEAIVMETARVSEKHQGKKIINMVGTLLLIVILGG